MTKSREVVVLEKRPKWATYLEDHEFRFVDHYLRDMNATAAYLANHPNVARTTAGVEGCKLLKKPNISAAIDAAIIGERSGSVRTQLANLFATLAFADPSDLMTITPEGVKPKNFANLTLEQRWALKRVKQTRGKTSGIEIETYDRLEAADKLARAVGMYRDEKQQTAVAVQVNINGRDSGA